MMKDFKISKELLSEVLKMEVVKHSLLNKSNKSFNVTYMQSEDSLKSSWTPVNIYEFVFKCKDWMIDKGYHINTSEDEINNYIYLYKMIKNDFGYEIDKSKRVQFDSKGYINNLFEACEWILKEQE